jgi:hypothetical protein
MRQIEVDVDVFAAIWALRRTGESTENEVLRRVLLERSGQLIVEHSGSMGAKTKTSNSGADLEAKDSELEGQAMETVPGKIRWVDDVLAALRSLGGKAMLHSIYKEVEQRRRVGGRSVPPELEATIRRTLEDHSSDSKNFRSINYFRNVSRGEWALR